MQKMWENYGPDSQINKTFTAAWQELMIKYGIDGDTIDAFSAEMKAMLEEMWRKYGPDGEEKDELLAFVKSLWSAIGAMGEEDGVSQWISSLFTSGQNSQSLSPLKVASTIKAPAASLSFPATASANALYSASEGRCHPAGQAPAASVQV